MADDARGLVAQAERDADGGDHASALKAIERAYVPVQKARDVETTERALALARRLAEEQSLEAPSGARHGASSRGTSCSPAGMPRASRVEPGCRPPVRFP